MFNRKRSEITLFQINQLEVFGKLYLKMLNAYNSKEVGIDIADVKEYKGRVDGACAVLGVDMLDAKEALVFSHPSYGELVRVFKDS